MSLPFLLLHNAGPADPRSQTAQQLFEAQAARTPDNLALTMGADHLSYRELNERSNRLAQFLRQQGTAADQRIGVYLDRSIETVVSLLAILKAGSTYLPLDPQFPQERLTFMVSDADTSLVLTTAAKLESLPPTPARSILLEEIGEALANYPVTNPSHSNGSEDLAYVIYTSGSTGNPKGVMIPHRALTNFLISMGERPGIEADDAVLALTTVSFDISLLEVLLPLIAGAHMVIASREQASDPDQLKELVEKQHITVMQATPTTWRMLQQRDWPGKQDLKILCGGEALTADLAAWLLPRCGELWNMYGPTETTIWSSTEHVLPARPISLGAPIANTQFYVVDENGQPVKAGGTGELLIGGDGLARGYLKRPELTADKFVPDVFGPASNGKLYRTGDEVRFCVDGSIEFIGRLDQQVKLNGFRIELGEIESRLANIEGVRQAVVAVKEDTPGEKRLIAYYSGPAALNSGVFTGALRTSLPAYMLPSAFIRVDQFPHTPNGKLDRQALPALATKRPVLAHEFIAPRTDLEKRLAASWCELLHIDEIGVDDSFFDLGGNSLLAVRLASLFQSQFGREIPLIKVFQYPTIAQLTRFIEGKNAENGTSPLRAEPAQSVTQGDVAIIGMVGRFPGADNLDQLWQNLCNGVESISSFTPEELGPGIDERLRTDPDYIRSRGIINGADLFDAGFFGIGPLEAKIMDPQQRVFLELAHHALENAGYDPERYRGLIGVFAGIGDNHYYTTNLLTRPDLMAMAGSLMVEYGNQKDYIALRTAYLLDLRGPAISLNTACSTTLLAVDQAYRALLEHECDVALAGGVDITVPQKSGFLYTEGGTFSRDGHCRPFDADATGTMFCDGAGVVVLKRLAEAIADGDTVYAVLKGCGKNNNGARPASFLAPSMEGQSEAIAIAQARAGVDLETIGYIEAHGTGTPLGDPIEIAALRKAFERKTHKKHFCYVGSIKGNIGHPTNAAGVAGLIKAAMVLYREQIPATLNYQKPNPKLDLANSPFLIADRLIPFPRGTTPRRAGVSSFGFGGTNVHVVLEEGPLQSAGSQSRPLQLLPFSARSSASLDAYSQSLASYFDTAKDDCFADAAFTLQTGRKLTARRRFVVAADPREAASLLRQPNPARCGSLICGRRDPPLVFLFGGQGTQYVNMGRGLYEAEPLFRAVVDHCCDILKPHLCRDLRELLFPVADDETAARLSLEDTYFTQPALFVIEYALARFWQSLGVQPSIMVGHSIGEFVAATLAGVWALEDALRIVARRGQLMQSLARGAMVAVRSSAASVAKLLPLNVQIASDNSPALCVVSGPMPDVNAFRAQLEAKKILCRPLHTSHAFHSAMMDPVLEPLRTEIAKVNLRPPTAPFVSTVTGRLITEKEATDPGYWARQARATVQFSSAISTLKEMGHDLFLECGPRSTLCQLTRQTFGSDHPCAAIPSLTDMHQDNAEWASMLFALGSLWMHGVSIDWDAFYVHEERRRIPLPGYPFERQRYWIDPAPRASVIEAAPSVAVLPGETEPAIQAVVSDSALPADRTVEKLLDIFATVSGCERTQIDRSATFLEQGFDSLSLMQVVFAIRKEFGTKVSFSELMHQLGNIEVLAEHLGREMPPKPVALELAAPAVTVPTTPTATASTIPQRGIFFSSQLSEPLSASYNECTTIRIEGPISIPALTASLQGLLDRHDALRVSFNETGSIMRVAPETKLTTPVSDLSGPISPSTRAARLRTIEEEETTRAFELPGGPLFRTRIVLLETNRAAAILTAHHTVCDGWSLDVLVHDFCALYSEQISGQPAGLEQAPSFANYANAVTLRERSTEFAEARKYWHEKFAAGFPALVLPTDFPRGGPRQHRAMRLEHSIEATVVDQLRVLAAKQGCSLFAVILSALSIFLARVSQQKRFVMALPAAEQPVVGEPGLVGHCVNLLPFLVELQGNETVATYLARVRNELNGAHERSAFTLVSLLEDLRPANGTRNVSPASVGLTSVKKFQPQDLTQRGFEVDYYGNPKHYESFECYFTTIESGSGLTLHCHYDTGLFRKSTAKAWLTDLEAVLVDMAADPEGEVLELAGLDSTRTSTPADLLLVGSTTTDSALQVAGPLPSPQSIAPREPDIRATLLNLWQVLLHCPEAGENDDFFDLGGHSLMAAHLFASIERQLGITAPLATLYTASTPRKLARILAKGDNPRQWQALVPINKEGSRLPLFLVHGAEGNVLLYRSLASHLGADQPVYGLQSAGLDGNSPVDGNFERVAQRYAEEIKRVQPEGPYLLGGYCLGATIALEIARQLMEDGHTVGLLAMIEHFNVQTIGWPLPWHLRAVNRLLLNPYFHFRNMLAARGSGKTDFLLEKLRTEARRAKAATRVAWARTQRQWKQGADQGFHHIKVAEVYDKALAAYEVRPYPGQITLFMSDRHLAGMSNRLGGWGGVAQGGVRLYSLPFHPKGSLIEPFVGHLAELLRGCIDGAITNSRVDSEELHPELVATGNVSKNRTSF